MNNSAIAGRDSRMPETPRIDTQLEHAGLVLASAVCTLVLAVLLSGYALWNGIALLASLGLQLAVASLGVWAVRNAQRVRAHFAVAARPELQVERGVTVRRTSRWGDGNVETTDVEELRIAMQEDAIHEWHIHLLFFLAGPAALFGIIALYSLTRFALPEEPVAQTQAIVFGLLSLAASCAWVVFARSYEALSEAQLPGSEKLALIFRETQWAGLFGAAGLFGSLVWAPFECWLARILVAWILAISAESLIRTGIAWRKTPGFDEDPLPQPTLALRRSLLVHGNPLTSLFEAFERRLGVSFRSSWTIRFARQAFLPLLLLSGLLYWGLTCLAIIGPSERGVRESFGVVAGQLGPGLHWKLPWPFGKVRHFEVKRIRSARVGGDGEEGKRLPKAILWSKAHAHHEFPLVLGSGTEAISVDALLYYKIREDEQGLLDYAYRMQNPLEALHGYAMRTLMEHTRSATLDEVLSVNRAEYAERLENDLRQYVERNRLGIEIVDLALINMHPPVASAAAYLGVISAEIDAVRLQLEAEGEKKSRIQDAQKESGRIIADSRVRAARRVGLATEESAQFLAVGQAYAVAPDAFRLRMSGDTIAEVLGAKSLTLIDPTFVSGEGQMILDLRPEVGRSDAAELP